MVMENGRYEKRVYKVIWNNTLAGNSTFLWKIRYVESQMPTRDERS